MNAHADRATQDGRHSPGPVRLDQASADREDAKSRLRARLLKMIVAHELSQKATSTEPSKPR